MREPWTWDAELDWEAKQEIRHEFGNGEPRAMTGATLTLGALHEGLDT